MGFRLCSSDNRGSTSSIEQSLPANKISSGSDGSHVVISLVYRFTAFFAAPHILLQGGGWGWLKRLHHQVGVAEC